MTKQKSNQKKDNDNVLKMEPKIVPENMLQNDALMNLESDIPYNLLVGSAGSGKTLLATIYAIKQFVQGYYKKIIITRPAVSVDESHGYLPGEISDKLAPWMIPITDIFLEFFDNATLEQYMNDGHIEIAPLAYMRGRTLGPIIMNNETDNRGHIVIADEMQNSTPEQMKMILTRISKNSKLIITGDLTQHDRGMDHNGLKDIVARSENKNLKCLTIDRFGDDQVIRSEAVKEVLSLY